MYGYQAWGTSAYQAKQTCLKVQIKLDFQFHHQPQYYLIYSHSDQGAHTHQSLYVDIEPTL
jgi:hypothetical protein